MENSSYRSSSESKWWEIFRLLLSQDQILFTHRLSMKASCFSWEGMTGFQANTMCWASNHKSKQQPNFLKQKSTHHISLWFTKLLQFVIMQGPSLLWLDGTSFGVFDVRGLERPISQMSQLCINKQSDLWTGAWDLSTLQSSVGRCWGGSGEWSDQHPSLRQPPLRTAAAQGV